MIEWLQEHLFSCYFLKYFHFPCPGCGMQRSFIALLQGHFSQSFVLYPALIPSLIMLLLLGIHLLIPFRGSLRWLLISFGINTTIVVINYIFTILQLINF